MGNIHTEFIKWISTIKDYSVHAPKSYIVKAFSNQKKHIILRCLKLKLQSHKSSKVKFTIVNGLKASHYVELLMQTLHYLHIGTHRTVLAMKTIYACKAVTVPQKHIMQV